MRDLRLVLACALLSACAGEGDMAAGRGATGERSGASSADEMGDGSAGTMSSPGGFGNSSATVPTFTEPPVDEDGEPVDPTECEVGVFCAPSEPDPDNCGSLRLESDVEVTTTPGNVLVIFDQSISMGEPWPGTGTSKLQAAQEALVAAVSSLQEQLTVGAIFFPSFACIPALPPPPGGAVAPIAASEQIDFLPAPDFLQAWNTKWSMPSISLGLGTPLQEAFDRADGAIQNASLTGQLAIVAFTDGEPNCFPDPNLTMVPTMAAPERAATWLGGGISTHVVGLPGANAVTVLDEIAQAGGTTSYIVPDDPTTLEAELRNIVEETVKSGFDSCSINLTPAADVPDELLMIVEEADVMGVQQVPRDRGWSLSDDGSQVEITGMLCEQAMSGRFSSITFEYACPEAPPPPAIPPLE